MKKLFFLVFFFIFSLSLFQSCEKEDVILTNPNLESQEAFSLNSFNKENFTSLKVNWQSKKVFKKNISSYDEIELSKLSDQEFTSMDESTIFFEYDINNSKKSKELYKLIAFKSFNNSNYNFYILKFSSNFNSDSSQSSYFKIDDYTGTINWLNKSGQKIRSEYYHKGILKETLKHTTKDKFPFRKNKCGAIELPRNSNANEYASRCNNNAGGWVKITTEHITDWYWVFTSGSTGELINIRYSRTTSNQTYEWVYVGGQTNYSNYNYSHSYGDESTSQPLAQEHVEHISENTILFEAPDNPIEDMENHLDCFDTSQNATVTIYADQPNPDNPNQDHYMGDVGHSFITIQQGDHNVSYGFYPAQGVGYFDATDGVMGNNENDTYDVSVTLNISGSTLQNLITHSISFSNSDYDLTESNCTSFAISSSNLIGLEVPLSECIGNYGFGDTGATPAAFGDYLRNMDLPEGATRNTSGGTSPNDNDCN